MEQKVFEFDAVIARVADIDGAYVAVPFDIKAMFGRGRLAVTATLLGEPFLHR